jgi:hypothetical protein
VPLDAGHRFVEKLDRGDFTASDEMCEAEPVKMIVLRESHCPLPIDRKVV